MHARALKSGRPTTMDEAATAKNSVASSVVDVVQSRRTIGKCGASERGETPKSVESPIAYWGTASCNARTKNIKDERRPIERCAASSRSSTARITLLHIFDLLSPSSHASSQLQLVSAARCHASQSTQMNTPLRPVALFKLLRRCRRDQCIYVLCVSAYFRSVRQREPPLCYYCLDV